MATFAMIHGAGDVGWYWHLVERELRSRGHESEAPDLPCDDDSAGLPEYARTVVDAMGDRDDVVVVAPVGRSGAQPVAAERVAGRADQVHPVHRGSLLPARLHAPGGRGASRHYS